jgi:hypothetical protein
VSRVLAVLESLARHFSMGEMSSVSVHSQQPEEGARKGKVDNWEAPKWTNMEPWKTLYAV